MTSGHGGGGGLECSGVYGRSLGLDEGMWNGYVAQTVKWLGGNVHKAGLCAAAPAWPPMSPQ